MRGLALALLLSAGAAWGQNQLPPGTTAPDDGNAQRAASDRSAAEEKIDAKDLAGARTLLVKYLEQHPNDARALFDLGYVEDAGNHSEAAAADYRKAIAADPKQFESRLALGLLLSRQGQYDQAREQVRAATELSPEPPNPAAQAEAYRTLARLERNSNPPAARDALVAALKLSQETNADLLLTAQIAEANGDTDLAKDAYQRLLSARSAPSPAEMAEANSGLAELLIKQQNFAEAEPLLRSSLARDPRNPAVNAQLATALIGQGKGEEALPILETLGQLEPDNTSVNELLARSYSEAGHPEKAETVYARLAAAHPRDEDILASQGENFLRSKHYAQAQEVLQKAVDLKPDDGEAWSGLAFAASENKDFQEALKALSMRAKFLPETPASYFLWATSYDNLHQSTQARDFYRKFLAAADGKFPDQEWQAQHRLVALGANH
jgi:tetratricopeptide (TPR) repeat protein